MKLIYTLMKSPIILCMFILFMQRSAAQVCSSPAGIVYGMDNSGGIFPINTSTAVVGARVNPPYTGNSPAASNAIGYNPGNGRFYYFKRNADQTPQEFVSFNPTTNAYTILANCPTTNNIRTGCVNAQGTGYYCIDGAARLYFYRFTSNTWQFITSNFIDQFGINVTAIMAARSSGDIAIDGWGDLWFLCSSTTEYGLYYFRGSLPVNPVASLNIIQKIAPTTPTPTGNNFAGIGFSPTGQIYLSQSGDKLYRMNNDLSLTLIGTFTTSNVGGDMTSCVMPFFALAINQIDLTAKLITDQQILISWSSQELDIKGYFIEYSADAETWTTLGYIESISNSSSNVKYTYTQTVTNNPKHYYRIRQVGMDGQYIYSAVTSVDINIDKNFIAVSPNPTRGNIHVNNNSHAFTTIFLMDITGKILKQTHLTKGVNLIALTSFPTGTYMIGMQTQNGETHFEKIIKE